MKKVLIEKKMTGTGSIYSLASEHYDRIIKFKNGCRFAFVEIAFYGGKGYKTFKSAEAAVAFWRKTDFMGKVIDDAGTLYFVNAVDFRIDEEFAYDVIDD